MSDPGPKPSADKTPEFSFTSMFDNFGKPSKEVNPYLDKARESVAKQFNKLKEQGKLKDTAANLYESIKNGFIDDLNELNIPAEEQGPYLIALDVAWKEYQKDRVAKEIGDSFEQKDVDNFIGKFEKELDPLEKAISNYKPQSQPLGTFLTQLTEQFPSLKPYLSFLGPLLTMFGLGSLKEEVAATSEAKDKKPDAKKKPKPKKGIEKKKAPKETLAYMPEKYVPKRTTLFVGDSNLEKNTKLQFKDGDKNVAIGGQQASWGINPIKRLEGGINDYGNLVLGFGGNDLGNKEPHEILGDYKKIVKYVREMNKEKKDSFKTKIFIVTTPPVGDGTKAKLSGKNWLENHDETNNKRLALNQMIRDAHSKNEFDFDEVVDMSATVKNGGVSNEAETAMAEGFDNHGDPIHVKPGKYAERIRFGIYLSDKKDEEKNNKIT